MKSISPELIQLYDALQKHTFGDCQKHCDHIASCCATEYCERTRAFSEAAGVSLPTTDHPTLPYMGTDGCTVAPHLRPECTEFSCCIRADTRGRPGDKPWTERYFELRRKIRRIQTS